MLRIRLVRTCHSVVISSRADSMLAALASGPSRQVRRDRREHRQRGDCCRSTRFARNELRRSRHPESGHALSPKSTPSHTPYAQDSRWRVRLYNRKEQTV